MQLHCHKLAQGYVQTNMCGESIFDKCLVLVPDENRLKSIILGTIVLVNPRFLNTASRKPDGTIMASVRNKLGLTQKKSVSKNSSASPPR